MQEEFLATVILAAIEQMHLRGLSLKEGRPKEGCYSFASGYSTGAHEPYAVRQKSFRGDRQGATKGYL